jgi:hypothetical protein
MLAAIIVVHGVSCHPIEYLDMRERLYAYFFSSRKLLDNKNFGTGVWGFFRTRSEGSFYVLLYIFYTWDGFLQQNACIV